MDHVPLRKFSACLTNEALPTAVTSDDVRYILYIKWHILIYEKYFSIEIELIRLLYVDIMNSYFYRISSLWSFIDSVVYW